jgi:hypothetical protein
MLSSTAGVGFSILRRTELPDTMNGCRSSGSALPWQTTERHEARGSGIDKEEQSPGPLHGLRDGKYRREG